MLCVIGVGSEERKGPDKGQGGHDDIDTTLEPQAWRADTVMVASA